MTDETALLAAIWASPQDDTVRLVYADWLEETGDPARVARAEFIRVQCEIEQLTATDPRLATLESRERELLKTWEKTWVAESGLPKLENGKFSRGFLGGNLAHLSMEKLLQRRAPTLKAVPLWRYHYGVHGRDLDRLFRWPQLHRLTLFALRPPLRKGWAQRVARSQRLRNVSELAFIECPVTPDDLQRILDAWTNRRLTELWLNDCPIGNAGFQVLAGHSAVRRLRVLRAHTSRITGGALRYLADSPHLSRLRTLTLANNELGAEGARQLLRWPGLRGLRELHLNETGIPSRLEKDLRKQLATRRR